MLLLKYSNSFTILLYRILRILILFKNFQVNGRVILKSFNLRW